MNDLQLVLPKLDLKVAEQALAATTFATTSYVEEVLVNQKHGVKFLTESLKKTN